MCSFHLTSRVPLAIDQKKAKVPAAKCCGQVVKRLKSPVFPLRSGSP
jgi:hypothetical protein